MEAKKLYAVTYFGLNKDGNKLFSFVRYYSDSAKAKAHILRLAESEYKQTLNSYLYPSRIDLYTQLKMYVEQDGEFKLMRHAVVSYSDGVEEESLADRRIVVNTNCELFKLL